MATNRLLRVVAVAACLVAACGTWGGASTNRPNQTSALTVAIGVDPDTLDPMRQTTTTVTNVVQMVVESFGHVGPDGKVQPSLATAWQESPDALSWTFTLRPGATFSDGIPFDAAAAKVNLDRILDPKSVCPSCGILPKAVRSVEVVDPMHLKLTLGMPVAADVVLGLLSSGTYGMQSPRGIQKGTPGYEKQEQPVGTGPYIFKERVPGDHVTLRRNENYWGQRPAYAQQVFKIVPDNATREALVRSGQAQVVLLPPISDLPSLQKDTTVKVLLAPSDRSVFVVIDTVDKQQPLLQNPQVRQALNYAVNREAIVKSTLFGAADPATSTLAPSLFGYCAQNPYQYNPDLAKSMLAKANASNLAITLIAPTGRYIQDFQAAQNVANDLRAIGVNVNGPRTMDWPSYVKTINVPPAGASVDMHMLGYAPGFLDASQAMAQFDPGQIPPRGLATAYYDNPSVTGLLAKAQLEANRDARAQEYCDAQKQVWSDAPWLFLWTQKFPIVYSSQVTGIGSIPTESFDTVYARPAH
ncbi:MAG TPA: ABC transporter substrate-binding protein [Candidatus Dormibacteraeota bacterium]|nr:ABC transporter substrate-binding protein [Candidatus Dormibacteraeota bacterium]